MASWKDCPWQMGYYFFMFQARMEQAKVEQQEWLKIQQAVQQQQHSTTGST